MTATRITKAKIREGQLHVELEGTDSDTERKITLRSMEGFHADLSAAFDALAIHVREILEWPSNLYDGVLTVTGVSWSHSENTGVEGAVLVCQAQLDGCTSPFCFNTPHLPFSQYCEDGNAPLMPDGAQDALNVLRTEVQRYIDGKRAQLDLFKSANLSGPYPVRGGDDLNDEIERDVRQTLREMRKDGCTVEVRTP
jgi:hypothetical protein